MRYLDAHKGSGWNSAIGRVPHFGINRRELDRLFVEIGGSVVSLRRTGEISYRHPLLPQRPKADGRRKDAPVSLVRFVRRVIETLGGSGKVTEANSAAEATNG